MEMFEVYLPEIAFADEMNACGCGCTGGQGEGSGTAPKPLK